MSERSIDWEKLKMDFRKELNWKQKLRMLWWSIVKHDNIEFFLDLIHEGKKVSEAYQIISNQ